MKTDEQLTKGRLCLSMLTHPIFVFVYWVLFYELYTLCQFGRTKYNIIILCGCMLFFIVWLITLIIRIIKKPATDEADQIMDSEEHNKSIWHYIAIIIIVTITAFYGFKIYHSAVNYNGKLSWYLNDLRNKKTIKFKHNNIYKDGVEGIFTDIDNKIKMPKKLYTSGNFSLDFDSDGTIKSFDTYLYGKNDKGKLESYLISYNSNKSKKITIYLHGYVNVDYNDDKLIKPLFDTIKVIPIKKAVGNWNEKLYGILYSGKRNWGYNTNGILYIDPSGNIRSAHTAYSEIIGYTVSVFVPGKENIYTPLRFNLVDNLDNINTTDSVRSNNNNQNSEKPKNGIDEFYLSKKAGYRLEVTGAAAGSRSYSLNATTDGGATWKVINEDPFSGMLGSAAGITFLNEKLGFLCLSHNGGDNGELYRTEDGGLSYTKVDFPEIKAVLNGGKTYNPFDLPGMPYEKDGILNILIGQGADGDYNGGSKALYQSKDNGKTWSYIKEVTAK